MSACTIIVNWNGWADTIECLESVLASDTPALPIVVCDNGSTDDSLARIRDWAEGRLSVWRPGSPLASRRREGAPKPVAYVEYDRATAEAGGDPGDRDLPLVLIRTGENLGFAGGNNVGLRYAAARGDRDFFWLLNNDTVAHPEALGELVAAARADPGLGMIGSTLLYYDAPDTVQAYGGAKYNRWLALARPIGALERASAPPPAEEVARQMDYVVAASMLVRRDFVEAVGLLNEEYFLYFEEIDWAMRARGRFRLGYAPRSIVYHKEGGSIGSGMRRAAEKTWVADYHFMRNRIRFTRRFVPLALPTVYLALVVAMARRAKRGQWDRIAMIARLCLKA